MGKAGVECGEVVFLPRDTKGSGRVSIKDFSIDSLREVYTSLDHGDAFIKDVVDVEAGLGATLLVEVEDGVMVGVNDVVLYSVMLNNAVGVLFVTITF